ncbi:MAG: TetR/AcrR family transcriptional regulator [Deltaproteobacteria bacterium]|nr:TetR/AcrR family transcriptional regulator [Deltaproteobacteria bacterium]
MARRGDRAADVGGVTGDEARKRALLDAALGVFLRFGFRKTSMEDVARAADISRQGLYLHFATKEELLRAAVGRLLATALAEASARLEDAARPPAERLAAGLDAWLGRFVGLDEAGGGDLVEAGEQLAGGLVGEHEARFVEALVKAVRAAGLVSVYRSARVNARQLAESLYATARGLKHGAATRADFARAIGVATRILCVPLHLA